MYPIQEILKQYIGDYQQVYDMTFQQSKIVNSIINCKTSNLGGHKSVCHDCGHESIHYNSCRDRHCPCCQSIVKEKWIDKIKSSLIDAPYFHTVITVPHELNNIFYSNQKIMYKLFYKVVSETLKELASDPKYHLEAEIGYISILHTWGRNLSYHPHIHVIVLGGGLNHKNEFVQTRDDFLFPTPVVSKLFRGKFLHYLEKLWKLDKLDYKPHSDREFLKIHSKLYKKTWITYTKKTFKRAENVIEYLGRYTHNIAISNHRILTYGDKFVKFRYKDYKTNSIKIMTLSPVEFIRRFLMHVLPKQFVKIRHYGILSNRNKKEKLSIIRTILDAPIYLPELLNLTTTEIILKLFNVNVLKCKVCDSLNIHTIELKRT